MTNQPISRRTVCVGALFTAACNKQSSPYFGRVTAPDQRKLRFVLGAEPDSLDPTFYSGGFEGYVTPAIFEGLVSYHPQSLEPIAALATHMEAGDSRLTFYLRGHPVPRGQALPNTTALAHQYRDGKLRQDFARGHHAPPDSQTALWSDGRPVTAHDFVFSWRRMVDPASAAPVAYFFLPIRNAEKILAGKLTADLLGVRALDDFTLQVDLDAPADALLRFLPVACFAALPQWAIEAARAAGSESAWMDPDRIVSNGPFRLRQRRPYDKTVLVRNPSYYEAGLVGLDEIEFLPLADGVRTAGLYRAGDIDSMPGERLSPLLQPVLEGCRDFHTSPAFFVLWHGFNLRKKPFDNLLLRYALNMATNKAEIAKAFGGGRLPAVNLIPPAAGYDPPRSLLAEIGGRTYDVLAYDPEAARGVLAQAGYANGKTSDGRPFSFEIVFPTLPHSKPVAEMLQQQWRRNLWVEPKLVLQEFTVWIQNLFGVNYPDVAEGGGWPDYLDPKGFFDWFANGLPMNGTGFSDPSFDTMLAAADLEPEPTVRMQKLAECERRLLRAMPVIPIYHNVWLYLEKPFVHGMEGNALDKHPFKYAWVDTNWKPQA